MNELMHCNENRETLPSFRMINFVSFTFVLKTLSYSMLSCNIIPLSYWSAYMKFVLVIAYMYATTKYEWSTYNDNYGNKIQLYCTTTQQKVNFGSGPAFV